jgi:hypothetical protein
MSFDGTWDVTVNSPMGAKTFRLAVSTEGGAVQGTVTADGASTPLVDPVLEDGHLRWSVQLPRPMNIRLDVDLTCAGDALAGVAKAGHMALPGVTGVRVGS